ncbi:hypothetical protein [Streptomyces cellulosae]|uniref:Uncharacterized protein n=1 Tax=Streptomyces cellulosae TaxID=1968 RepID=A0ABW7XZV3_STRCE
MLDEPLRRHHPNTPATATGLRAALDEIRRHGYAYCPGYTHADALGVAAASA